MEHDADRNFPHSKNEPNSPTLNSQTLKNQLRKGAWLQRSFTLSTIHPPRSACPPRRANAFGVNSQLFSRASCLSIFLLRRKHRRLAHSLRPSFIIFPSYFLLPPTPSSFLIETRSPPGPLCRIPVTLLRWTQYALALDD